MHEFADINDKLVIKNLLVNLDNMLDVIRCSCPEWEESDVFSKALNEFSLYSLYLYSLEEKE